MQYPGDDKAKSAQEGQPMNVEYPRFEPMQGAPEQPPQGAPVYIYQSPSQPPPVPPQPTQPASPNVIIIDQEQQLKICNNCKQSFFKHSERLGISWGLLVLTVILSICMPLFLLLFIAFCHKYPVCPRCGKFTGHGGSTSKNVCLS